MALGPKIPCTCHQAKLALRRQMQLVVPIAPKICVGGVIHTLNPNLWSDFLSDNTRHTSFKLLLL